MLNNERIFRRTAEGAAAQAISRLDDIPARPCASAFTAATPASPTLLVRIGERLGNPVAGRARSRCFDSLAQLDVSEQGTDVISGLAGADARLLLMHKKFNARASRSCVTLRGPSRRNGRSAAILGCSWRTIEPTTPDQRNLTGFSHGTAGIAWAMLELAQASGESALKSGRSGVCLRTLLLCARPRQLARFS